MPNRSNLSTYNEKRNFKKTSEPRGRDLSRESGSRESTRNLAKETRQFVIQRHEASRLHWDFRLELDGVLKSWAVPKEPLMDPSVKRLAVQVEDHPVEYAKFSGDIPEGEYGAGHVDIWDRGAWVSLDEDPLEAYEKGKLNFELKGTRLKGRWALIRSSGWGGKSSKKNWLLIKAKDDKATNNQPETKKTTRAKSAKGTKRANFIEPQLATLVDRAPTGAGWIFEQKYDGYRIMVAIRNGRVRLMTRNGNDWTKKFLDVAKAFEASGLEDAYFDGELVALNEKGVSEFQVLQNSLVDQEKAGELVYYAFDLLESDGKDLRSLPLIERKAKLERLMKKLDSARVRFSSHEQGDSEKRFEAACRRGLEGIICKQSDAPYRKGRNEDWLKVKCVQRQEFVIVGYTDPTGAREKFGALLLASRDGEQDDALRFVGKVGTGFNRKSLGDLHARLSKLASKASPLKEKVNGKGVHWVKPELVAEITFTAWTHDGILRHPSFEGLREDKPAADVTIEQPKPLKKIARSIAGEIELTHPERVLFADQGVTKEDLAAYYAMVEEKMLPHVLRRPLTLIRCPQGSQKACFFQKHTKSNLGHGIGLVSVAEKEKEDTYMEVEAATGLRTLVQYGALELHVWGSRSDKIEKPDQLVFDFDPDLSTSWSEVVRAIQDFRKFLEAIGMKPFLKLSGKKGAHVHVPIERKAKWDEVHEFATRIAQEMEARDPETYTASSLKKDRKGKIYLDYVRNSRGVSYVAPYSTRVKAGGSIAAPIFWDELNKKIKPDQFSVRDFEKRLAKLKEDPWEKFFESAVSLPRLGKRKRK